MQSIMKWNAYFTPNNAWKEANETQKVSATNNGLKLAFIPQENIARSRC